MWVRSSERPFCHKKTNFFLDIQHVSSLTSLLFSVNNANLMISSLSLSLSLSHTKGQTHCLIGWYSRWSLIARHLPGRTDNDVKNYWNTKLRKKLSTMGIDPITHKPISQVLSDYGNINSFPNTENLIGSFGKNLRNTLIPKIEPSSITNGLQNNCMVMKPMIEQVQDNSSAADNISWNILAQGQISNLGFIQPNFFSEVTSSCSSSSPTAFSQLSSPQSSSFQASQSQITPTPFSWSEFLLSDSPSHENSQQQQEHKFPGMSPTKSSTMTHKEISHCKANGGSDHNLDSWSSGFGAYDYSSSTMNQVSIHTDASSSSASSFVDAILDRDIEIHSQFPESFFWLLSSILRLMI